MTWHDVGGKVFEVSTGILIS